VSSTLREALETSELEIAQPVDVTPVRPILGRENRAAALRATAVIIHSAGLPGSSVLAHHSGGFGQAKPRM
jgi:hypothetical protein